MDDNARTPCEEYGCIFEAHHDDVTEEGTLYRCVDCHNSYRD